MSLEIILTEDGSSSLLVPELDETYHSIRGAINESKHVFIDAGLKHRQSLNSNPNINILEIGFGTGLNTLLTALNCGTSTIYYTSIESRPLPKNIWGKLNYPGQLDDAKATIVFSKIHESKWGEEVEIDANFFLTKIESEVQQFDTEAKFDIIFFDAFAPEKQPEMWDIIILGKMAELLVNGGLLVTYCVKGQVKRSLRSAGFSVKRLPGPPGKFHMLRASK